jgi:putative peptidoglycan lipid II flippase
VVVGLMFGNGVSFVFAAGLGYWLLRKRLGRLGLTRVGTTLLRLAFAAAVAAVPAALVVYGLSAGIGDGKVGSFVQLVVGGAVLLGGYVVAAIALRIREVTELGGMLKARLGR